MPKLSKQDAARHLEALALVDADRDLTHDERLFIIENYRPDATNLNGLTGAFFTPYGLAREMAIMFGCNYPATVIDLCAGIGTLSRAYLDTDHEVRRLICIEINPEYVKVGRRLVPEADWIQASIYDVLPWKTERPRLDLALTNPPFGSVRTAQVGTGLPTELQVVDLGLMTADRVAAILPPASAGHYYSGRQGYRDLAGTDQGRHYDALAARWPGLERVYSSIDTAFYADQWKGVKPAVELIAFEVDREDVPAPTGAGQLALGL